MGGCIHIDKVNAAQGTAVTVRKLFLALQVFVHNYPISSASHTTT